MAERRGEGNRVTRRLIVCTTFRSFDGSPNDRIQRQFLRGLAAQTHADWELVVTIFGETGVEETLQDAGVPFTVFRGSTGDYRFSLTEVLSNAVTHSDSLGRGTGIVLWTTCDVVFPPHLFAGIVGRFKPGDAGTSHPHREAASFDDYTAGRIDDVLPYAPLSRETRYEGIDFVYFDADLFAPGSPSRAALEEYRFVDWGLFEHFLTGLARLYAGRRLNLWASAPVVKIGNDREVGQETAAYLKRAWDRNYVPMRRFLDHYALGDGLLRLHDCHKQFELVGRARYLRRLGAHHARQASVRMLQRVVDQLRSYANRLSLTAKQ
jgi:hypothetical protein